MDVLILIRDHNAAAAAVGSTATNVLRTTGARTTGVVLSSSC